MHFKLLAPGSGNFFRSEMTDYGVSTNPLDQKEVLARLAELSSRGHTYEIVDSERLTPESRAALYASEGFAAVAHAGNSYRIRQVFGSRRNSGAEHFGTATPALVTFEEGQPIDIHPHQAGDQYVTIRAYLDSVTK
jgi:hypothetical protein